MAILLIMVFCRMVSAAAPIQIVMHSVRRGVSIMVRDAFAIGALLACIAITTATGAPAIPKYRCLQLQNNDFHSYMLNICILNGAPPPKYFTGWTSTGKQWVTFDCTNCDTYPPAETAALPAALMTNSTTGRTAGNSTKVEAPLEMFPCCWYSDKAKSYLEPMDGVGQDPAVPGDETCKNIYLGLNLFAAWQMDSMEDCDAFGPYLNRTAVKEKLSGS